MAIKLISMTYHIYSLMIIFALLHASKITTTRRWPVQARVHVPAAEFKESTKLIFYSKHCLNNA